jgi:DNA-binding transcriptional ArsR family regulator
MSGLDATFAALANPTRRAIVERLARGDATVGQLVERFDLRQPTISSHLKVLEDAGLIVRGRMAQTRPCRLSPEGLKAAAEWMRTYERFWLTTIDRFVEQAESTAGKE